MIAAGKIEALPTPHYSKGTHGQSQIRHRLGRPFGSESWAAKSAARLGVSSTPRPRGWPQKTEIMNCHRLFRGLT
jgi:hypothetical protein